MRVYLLSQALYRATADISFFVGLVGAFAGENDPDVANAPTRSQGTADPGTGTIEWVVALEGADPRATAAAARATLPRRALAAFGVRVAPKVGTYTLLFGNDR